MEATKLKPKERELLDRINQHSGNLLMLSVTASGGMDRRLNDLRRAGYVVKIDHPTVKDGGWPAEALAITDEGRAALSIKT